MTTLFVFVVIHSCVDIRDSGDSRGDGEYWIDPERSGNPLKVFCDMTTDGGRLWWIDQTNSKIYDLNNLKTAEGHAVIGSLSKHDGNARTTSLKSYFIVYGILKSFTLFITVKSITKSNLGH